MSSPSPARKRVLGLLLFIITAALGVLGTRVAQGAFADDYRFSVVVGETGQGIIAGSDVVARGVIVGEVGRIELTDDLRASVELVLEPQYRVPEGAVFAVTGKTLLGEKQVEIRFDGAMGAGESIAEGEVVDDPDQVVELQDVLGELDQVLGAIEPTDLAVVVDEGLGAFVGQEDAIARAVDQGARATGVFAGSLGDQVPAIRDLSLVAEALGPVGDEFNRLGSTIDAGALDAVSANQARLRVLLASLRSFGDQADVVLELTRPDLDRLIVEGDNVTRMLWTYRPEVAEVLVGIDDYSDTIGNGGLTDPGFAGFGAGFQILLENPFGEQFCASVGAALGALIPVCTEGPHPEPQLPPGPHPPALPDLGLPELPDAGLPVAEVPAAVQTAPDAGAAGGIETILEGVMSPLGGLLGAGGEGG